jgi:hypothetical protein
VGFGFAAIQLAFLGVMKFFQPADADAIYGVEIFSFALVLIFLPVLAGIRIPWPHPTLEKLESLVILCVFLGIHGISKLATFYAFLQGQLGTRKTVPYWLGSSLACAVLALVLVNVNLKSIEAARPTPDTTISTIQVGQEWAQGIKLQEGASISREYTLEGPASIRFLWAPTRNYPSDKLYVTFNFYGAKEINYTASVNLYADRWSATTVPHSAIPKGCYRYDMYWTHEAEPNWVSIFKIRPVSYSKKTGASPNMVWASGPFELPFDEDESNYNLIFLIMEGLGSNHIGEFGYARAVTPNIDAFTKQSRSHLNGYNSEFELSKYLDSFLNAQGDRIPNQFGAHGYATASFTESEHHPDVVHVPELGFQWANQTYTPKGSLDTLQRVEEWIHNNRENNFMVLVRLSELVNERSATNYKKVFPAEGPEKDIDRFDNTLLSMDRGIGALIQYIKSQPWGKKTIIVLTSPYGQEFSLGSSRSKLDRKSTRTPIIIHIPGQKGRTRTARTTLNDMHKTLNDYFPF